MTVIDLKTHAATQTPPKAWPMPQTEHPKAIEARKLAAIRRTELALVKGAIVTHGVHFFQRGLYTFCYKREGRNIIEVATSIRHPNDKHDPHIGKREALSYFMQGGRTQFRVPKGQHPRQFLHTMCICALED